MLSRPLIFSLVPRPKNLRLEEALSNLRFLTRDVKESLVREPDYLILAYVKIMGNSLDDSIQIKGRTIFRLRHVLNLEREGGFL